MENKTNLQTKQQPCVKIETFYPRKTSKHKNLKTSGLRRINNKGRATTKGKLEFNGITHHDPTLKSQIILLAEKFKKLHKKYLIWKNKEENNKRFQVNLIFCHKKQISTHKS